MKSITEVEKTIVAIKSEKISSSFRITPGRLNEVFSLLKIPYKAHSASVGKGMRTYELENVKGEKVQFGSMKELLFATPIAGEIRKRAVKMLKVQHGFFSDLAQKIVEKNHDSGNVSKKVVRRVRKAA